MGDTTRFSAWPALFLLTVACFFLIHPCRALTNNFTDEQWRDYRDISNGMTTVSTGGEGASKLLVHSPRAVIIATDDKGVPYITATRYGSGRAAFYGHQAMITKRSPELRRLGRNIAKWASADAPGVPGNPNLKRVAWFKPDFGAPVAKYFVDKDPSAFLDVGEIQPSDLSIEEADFYIINGQEPAFGEAATAIQKFVRQGGGLLSGAEAWSNFGTQDDAHLSPGSRVMTEMGITLTNQYLYWQDNYYFNGSPATQIGNAAIALQGLVDTRQGLTTSQFYLTPSEDKTAFQVIMLVTWVPSFDERIMKVEQSSSITVTGIDPKNPVRKTSTDAIAVLARTVRYMRSPPNQLPEAPEAKFFPGLPPAGAPGPGPQLTIQIQGNTQAVFWQCLGVWAMAGRAVRIDLPSELRSILSDVTVHIGPWSDSLWHRDEWKRLPKIFRVFHPETTSVTVATAVGGLIYVTLPKGLSLGTLTVSVTGAIRAPMYTQGVTSVSDWGTQLSTSVAPWGEIGSSKLVISVPTTSLQRVKDPVSVMEYWDKVMDSHAWMANIPSVRKSPMRIVHDVQISVGYMHSGYPIMSHMDRVDTILDLGSGGTQHWGEFHELGHNHQQSVWTWECTTEVTVNLFTARAEYVVRKNTNPENFYGWFGDYTTRRQQRQKYFDDGPDYDKLCDSPSLYLDSFLQVVEVGGFGFELIKETIASYQTIPKEQLPKTDNEKLNFWVLQQSQIAGWNFAPYYLSWGWPVTSDTSDKLSNLPTFVVPSIGGASSI